MWSVNNASIVKCIGELILLAIKSIMLTLWRGDVGEGMRLKRRKEVRQVASLIVGVGGDDDDD